MDLSYSVAGCKVYETIDSLAGRGRGRSSLRRSFYGDCRALGSRPRWDGNEKGGEVGGVALVNGLAGYAMETPFLDVTGDLVQ
jgi:hypothetical protein